MGRTIARCHDPIETMENKKFKDCTVAFLEKTFHLNEVERHAVLTDWLTRATVQEITPFEQTTLEYLRAVLTFKVRDWNEIELIEQFIGPVMTLVNFNTKTFSVYAERELHATINDIILFGNPDLMIAKGRREPEIPYFCFNEYKRAEETRGDSVGQVLASMLVAQALNGQTLPIYGVTVMGEKWRFLILQGREYCLSHAFVADTDHLFDIFRILKALKVMLIEIAQQEV